MLMVCEKKSFPESIAVDNDKTPWIPSNYSIILNDDGARKKVCSFVDNKIEYGDNGYL